MLNATGLSDVQILKQLSGNPKAESIAKGWQLMCMCVTTFPPSAGFQVRRNTPAVRMTP